MKRYLYIYVCSLFLLASCSQEEGNTPQGYLSLASLSLADVTTQTVGTRAVDADLIVEITGEDGSYSQTFQAADLNRKIALDAGNYTLTAYTASRQEQSAWTNSDAGSPIYYVADYPFTIRSGAITYPQLQVPMTNFGIRLVLPDNFFTFFTNCSFSATTSGGSTTRTVGLQNGETAYALEGATSFTYALAATNVDGELYVEEGNLPITAAAGVVYELTYSYETNTLVVR